MTKHIIWIILFLFFAAGCSKLSNSGDNQEEELIIADIDLDKILDKGKLTAIFDNNSTNYFIYKGQPMGYEYELLTRFCDKIGVELEIKIVENINQAFAMLNEGSADIIAYFLAITKDRKKIIGYTDRLVTTRQVLVQRKPENWQKMSGANVSRQLIRNQVDLIGQKVHVRANSSFYDRLQHLSEEIGGDIDIVTVDESIETERLIRMVAEGEIKYTVSDEELALVNAAYFPILDVETPVSFPQQIAWGIRKNATQLQESLNEFISEITSTALHQIIYNRYFKVNRRLVARAQSEFSSISGTQISEYDDIIKKWADSINWDWKLMASMMYEESRFKNDVKSWAGAFGLMQVMPATGKRFGATNLYDPEQNIMAGARFINYLENYWSKHVDDTVQRKKFILASYNVGLGHVQDAVILAENLNYETDFWDGQVEECMKLKSNPEYFRREEVRYGYARGQSVVRYVSNIWNRYEEYLLHFEKLDEEEQTISD